MVKKTEAKQYIYMCIYTNILCDWTQLLRQNFLHESFCKYVRKYIKVMRSHGFWVVLVGLFWTSGKPESQTEGKTFDSLDPAASFPSLKPGQGQPPAEEKFSCCTLFTSLSGKRGGTEGEDDFLFQHRESCYHLHCFHQAVLMCS